LYELSEDQLGAAAQYMGGELWAGLTWRYKRAPDDHEPEAVDALRKEATRILGDIRTADEWWLASRVDPMEDIYQVSDTRAREIGRLLGELLRETSPAIRRTNQKLGSARS